MRIIFACKLIVIGVLCLYAACLSAVERGLAVVSVTDDNGQEVGSFGESHALLIGCGVYEDAGSWSRLDGVGQDMRAISQALHQHGFIVHELTDPGSRALEDGIEDFIHGPGAISSNRLLIYYAGHGYTTNPKTDDEMGWVVPVDAPHPIRAEGAFRRKALSMRQVETYAETIIARHALFVFDSCFSGSLIKLRQGATMPPAISAKICRPVRQFMTSGSANQMVPDKSEFRRYFIRGIDGEADFNQDGWVTGTELGEHLFNQVVAASRHSQTPQIGKHRLARFSEGDFVFRVNDQGDSRLSSVMTGQEAENPDPVLEWLEKQERMEKAFAVALKVEESNLDYEHKRARWLAFKRDYAEDNPYSTHDEKLRKKADNYLLDGHPLKQVVVPKPASANQIQILRYVHDRFPEVWQAVSKGISIDTFKTDFSMTKTLIAELRKLHPHVMETLKDNSERHPVINGLIAAIRRSPDGKQDLVMLTVGRDEKVTPEMEFTIYRGNQYLVKVRIERVLPDMSAGRVIQSTWNARGHEFQVGDSATNKTF